MLDGIVPQNGYQKITSTEPEIDDAVFSSILGYTPVADFADLIATGQAAQTLVTDETTSLKGEGLSEVSVEEEKGNPFSDKGLPFLGQPEKVSYADAQIQEIEVTKIVPNPYQPRKIFDPEGLKELANSIREHGVIQPIVVTLTAAGYELVVGERRFRASILAGLHSVPAIVKQSLGDQTKLEVALIENIQRRELNAIEEARAYDRLIKTFNLTQEQVAQKVGKSRPAVTNTLRLLNLPVEIQRAVIENRITEGHARAILGVSEPEKQLALFKAILEQNLNVRQVEAKAKELSQKRAMDAVAPDPKLMAIESELRTRLGAQVKVQRQGRGGKITIEFFSDEDLQDIMQKMAEHVGSLNSQQGNNNSTPYFTV